mmetsp:Transcript_7506/g.18682  ORF Transcript_7506/g.18682 Transcript_7506/m.18682 type:complete len:205 (+) Transcript_7506:1111-1725(+)
MISPSAARPQVKQTFSLLFTTGGISTCRVSRAGLTRRTTTGSLSRTMSRFLLAASKPQTVATLSPSRRTRSPSRAWRRWRCLSVCALPTSTSNLRRLWNSAEEAPHWTTAVGNATNGVPAGMQPSIKASSLEPRRRQHMAGGSSAGVGRGTRQAARNESGLLSPSSSTGHRPPLVAPATTPLRPLSSGRCTRKRTSTCLRIIAA